ncbi:MAG TPA: hypothetical protein PKW62_06045 [Chitinophagaceae bacterium]|nr:hypothetical protein [Chitinophagaceae bacterium]
MENLNFHKLKLYSLILAGVALISMLLPWFSVSGGFMKVSRNGFGSWGLISLIGIGVVAAACFMGDKTKVFDDMGKKLALGGFAGIAGGAVIYLIRVLTVGGGYGGMVKASPGFGLFIALLAGVAGLLIVLGKVKLPEDKPKA